MRVFLFSLPLIFAISGAAQAHGGRTNAQGCHNDRKTGGYHCHNGGSAPAAAPVRARPAGASRSPQVPQIHYPSKAPGIGEPASQRSEESTTEESQALFVNPDFYFGSCAEVRASGRTVLRTVKEGYRPELDTNRNGIACDE